MYADVILCYVFTRTITSKRNFQLFLNFSISIFKIIFLITIIHYSNNAPFLFIYMDESKVGGTFKPILFLTGQGTLFWEFSLVTTGHSSVQRAPAGMGS